MIFVIGFLHSTLFLGDSSKLLCIAIISIAEKYSMGSTSLFNYLLTEGQRGCFKFLTNRDTAAMNIHLQIFFSKLNLTLSEINT